MTTRPCRDAEGQRSEREPESELLATQRAPDRALTPAEIQAETGDQPGKTVFSALDHLKAQGLVEPGSRSFAPARQ
ncbi:hypothetical protein [Streptomyces guryensis]|uniref:Uncharacterized protein n=1 Tax=Streptomyces guryensis TaxID=2886947 RepID=A0A9Q3VYA4_9ACTN|nr:hypothetical protein [Streptomyces guryensis]MCD9880749.1 hypothetical protein [Streptomyces guryensis]